MYTSPLGRREGICLPLKFKMEYKFLSLALFVLFAAFGSIETTWTNHTGDSWSGYNGRSSSQGGYDSSSPYRPFGTVPPPRGSGNYSTQNPWIRTTTPLKPFGTVPPPRGSGNYSVQNPWIRTTTYRPICNDSWSMNSPCRQFGTVPPPRHPGTGWNQGNPYPGQGYNLSHFGGENRPYYYSSRFNNEPHNASTGQFNQSTSLYPSLAGL